jgi:predicted nucleic acid-binding Zn ribbon protein
MPAAPEAPRLIRPGNSLFGLSRSTVHKPARVVLNSLASDPPLATVGERALMERAARVLQKNKFSKSLLGDEDVVRALWFAAAGKVIHAHTSRVRLVRKTLVVEVEDSIWQRQLRGLSEQILARVRKLTGQEAIADLEFRVGVPRRLPQRSQTATGASAPANPADEAEQIRDPMLKKVYQLSRKKASA